MINNRQQLVSVIIPNYNHTHFLPGAIESVLAQSYSNHEIIVVDDGSTDESRDVVARFGEKVRYIWQENQGLAGARNTGIQAAGGELISLLDADDKWYPDYLEHMVALSETHPYAAVYYCMAQCMDVEEHDLPQYVGGPPVDPNVLYQVLLRANFIIPSTVLFRRKPVIESGSFDANLRSCEDWDLWLRLLPSEKIVGTSRCLVRYRVHGSSLSTNVDGMHTATKKVIEKHFDMDEGDPSTWKPEKRRAYGGVYRYHVLTSIQRQMDWESAGKYLDKALEFDPSLSMDLDLFYEIALGDQPQGFRGTDQHISLDSNIKNIELLLDSIHSSHDVALRSLRNRTHGTAYYAIGLVAYQCRCRLLSRAYFIKAIKSRPELVFDFHVISSLFKSYLNNSLLQWLRRVRMEIQKIKSAGRIVE